MAGKVTQTWSQTRNRNLTVWKVQLAWVGDSSNGSVPATALSADVLSKVAGDYLFMLKTVPGAVASGGVVPTSYSITLTDSDGLDVLGGVGATRSATVVERTIPKQDSSQALYGPVYTSLPLTLNITGQTNVSATGSIYLYFSGNG